MGDSQKISSLVTGGAASAGPPLGPALGPLGVNIMEMYRREMPKVPRAICFGGTHYPEKFTKMVLQGEYALGTIVPKHSLEYIDESMFSHILKSNPDTSTVLLDSGGLGKFKTDIISMAEASNLEVVKL